MESKKRVFEPRVKRRYIGSYHPRTDAVQKASGTAKYAQDLAIKRKFPDMVYVKILKSPYPNALIRSVDSSKAEALPGVAAVLRYDDPEVKAMKPTGACWTDGTGTVDRAHCWMEGCYDRRVLDTHARWVGDELGVAVAAETVETAEEAIRLLDVEWEQLPFCLTPEEALRPDAPILHPEVNPDNNFIPHYRMWGPDVMVDEGDVEKALAEAEVTVEAQIAYRNPQQCALDYWNCLVDWKEEQMLVISDSYAVDQTRQHMHGMFDIPLKDIRVITPFEGGQHGRANAGDQTFFLVTALLSRKTGRPARYFETRKEHFHDTRTRVEGKLRLGATKDGVITAADFEELANAGAYAEATNGEIKFVPPEWIETMLGNVPNLRFTSRAVYTNIIPSGCMRSIGNIQMNFLFGLAMDMLGEKLGMDPVELTVKNVSNVGFAVPNASVEGVLREGARRIGWEKRHAPGKGEWFEGTKKRGIGFSLNNTWHVEHMETRRGPTQVMIKLNSDGSVILDAPTVEVGGGSSTCAVLACAETLGVPFENIRWIAHQDTETGLKDVVQSDSSVSLVLSEAVHQCAQKLKKEFLGLVGKKLGRDPEEMDMIEGRAFVKAEPEVGMTIQEYYESLDLMEEGTLVPLTMMISKPITQENRGVAYMATFVEVEVDTETGVVEVLRMYVCSDGGTVLFPAGAEGQLVGGQCQGLGEALYEEMIYDEATGIPLNFNFVDYKFPTMADFPDVDPIPMEILEGVGEYGSSGMGEGAPCCTPRAIANAIYNAVGVRINETAITPMKVLKALEKEGR